MNAVFKMLDKENLQLASSDQSVSAIDEKWMIAQLLCGPRTFVAQKVRRCNHRLFDGYIYRCFHKDST